MLSPAHTTYPDGDVVAGVGRELAARAAAAMAAGILPWNLVLDPGLGFAKTPADSLRLLGGLARLRREFLPGVLGRLPLLVGASRKGFLGALTGGCGRRPRGGGGSGPYAVALLPELWGLQSLMWRALTHAAAEHPSHPPPPRRPQAACRPRQRHRGGLHSGHYAGR